MFFLAFLIGIYSYSILFLGLINKLDKVYIGLITIIFLLTALFLLIKKINKRMKRQFYKNFIQDKLSLITFSLIIVGVLINFIGALGSELSFDALWYHLTLPKLYLEKGRIFFIPGGLLYYSSFPQLTEMIYLACLIFKGEILAKLVHFSFGIGCLFALFKLLKKYSNGLALMGCLFFYSQLAVGWLSTTAYIDLARAFFEILSLVYFIKWLNNNSNSNLIKVGVLTGLAIATKLLAIFSFISYIILIFLCSRQKRYKNLIIYLFSSILIPLPWIILSIVNAKNPLYPLFTNWFFITQSQGLSLLVWLKSRIGLNIIKVILATAFTKGDILSPLILITLPIIFFKIRLIVNSKYTKIVGLFFIINFFFFYLTPLNYNRFLLPYLAAYIYVLTFVLSKFKSEDNNIKKIFFLSLILTVIINFSVRSLMNKKYLPVILAKQTKQEFLDQNLNFPAGNFYDVDGWFSNNIKPEDRVLIIGTHNLYYIDFPFDHISWAKNGTYFSHVLVQNQQFPANFAKIPLVYKNSKTGIEVFNFDKKL